MFQSVEGLKKWRLLGALALTKGESGDYGMCVGFIPQLELCDGWENGKVKRRIDLFNERKPLQATIIGKFQRIISCHGICLKNV